jgi:hypothetical protein
MNESWHQCDCGIYVSDRGNEQFDQPHFGPFEKIDGSCSSCITTLTRLGVPIVNNLSGGGVDKEHALAISVDHESNSLDRAEAQHGQLTQKPVCSRPTAQFNFYRSTPPEMAAQGMAATVEEGTAQKLVSVNAGNQFPIASVNRDSRKDGINFRRAA